MFTLALTRAERAAISNAQGVEGGPFPSLLLAIAYCTHHPAEHFRDGRWDDCEEEIALLVLPTHAREFLPFLTGEQLKQYSPDLANKLAALRGWINSPQTGNAGE